MNRTALRETVFKVLFRYEFHDSESFASQMNLFFAEYPESGDEEENWPALDSKSAEEITGKVTDILYHIDEIDKVISGMQKINGNSLFLPPQRHTFAHRKKKNCLPFRYSSLSFFIIFCFS